MDFDLDDPEDAVFVLAVLDDEEDSAGAGSRDPSGDAVRPAPPTAPSGCAPGCGCAGCLLPVLVIVAATAAGSSALPLAGLLGLAALVLAVIDRTER